MGLKERIIERLHQKRRAAATAGLVGVVIGVFVSLILVAATFPTAFQQIFTANTSGWTSSTVSLWQLIPLIGALSVVLLLVGLALTVFGARK